MNRVLNNMLFIAVGWPDVWDCKAFLSTLPSSHTRRQCPAIWLAAVYNSERCLRKVLLEEMIHACMFPEIQIQEYNSCCNRYWSRKHELYTDYNTSTIKKTLPSIYAYSSLVGCKCISFMNDQSFFLSAHYAPHRYVLCFKMHLKILFMFYMDRDGKSTFGSLHLSWPKPPLTDYHS